MSDYWKDNGIKKPQQVVVCAAVFDEKSGTLILGARHWDKVMHNHYEALPEADRPRAPRMLQGFIDQFGVFLTREDALQIARASGQLLNPEFERCHKKLFSEDLY